LDESQLSFEPTGSTGFPPVTHCRVFSSVPRNDESKPERHLVAEHDYPDTNEYKWALIPLMPAVFLSVLASVMGAVRYRRSRKIPKATAKMTNDER
jgi:hypothetical protein